MEQEGSRRLFLLDTHVLLWAVVLPARIPHSVASLLVDPANLISFSAASIWEIAIKAALRRPEFDADPNDIASAATAIGFSELPVTASVAAAVALLPLYHRDPFDRLLVAQAKHIPATLITADRKLERYSDLVMRFEPR